VIDNAVALLLASAEASVRFAVACLEPVGQHLRAKSSFVDPTGAIMHWHDFGDLEGPGWAANAIGGAHLLYRWGLYLEKTDLHEGNALEAVRVTACQLQEKALVLLDHVLEDGFVRPDGFVWPYYHVGRNAFCLNYAHTNDWLCPGSLAKIGTQMLDFAAALEAVTGKVERIASQGPSIPGERRVVRLREIAARLGRWLENHVPRLENGWVPRRITLDGEPYPYTPEGAPDPIYDHSADGLFLLELWARLGEVVASHEKRTEEQGPPTRARELGDAFVAAGGHWGSLNHDTYDDHENVAYAVAFRILRRIAAPLNRPTWPMFAYDVALPALQRFRMEENRHGVVTRGLFWMEESWDTAYLWENAEIAQAYLEAWIETGDQAHRDVALGVLSAIAQHHYGSLGFLTEGVDWNNHVGQQHHVDQAEFGAIRYTEPLLNNLHHIGPTLTYLTRL
jgi:hypothetical protein